MSDLETQVGSILEIMVNATVTEMTKVIGGCDSTRPEASPCSVTTENTQGSSDEKVIQLSVFMTSLAREAVEKICQLFHECSSLLQLEVRQDVAETEDLRRRLEVAETELKLVLEGNGGQTEAEELTEGGSEQKEGKRAPANGAEGEAVPTGQRSGRKSRRAVASGDAGVKRSPIIHLWKGRAYEDTVQPVIIKEEKLEAFADQASSDSGQNRDDPGQDDDDDPDYQLYKRRNFLEELGKTLVTTHIQRRQHLPGTPAAAATVREIQERTAPSTPVLEVAAGGKRKRKRCQVCRPSDDVKTSMTCAKCAKFICTKHSVVTCHSCAV